MYQYLVLDSTDSNICFNNNIHVQAVLTQMLTGTLLSKYNSDLNGLNLIVT